MENQTTSSELQHPALDLLSSLAAAADLTVEKSSLFDGIEFILGEHVATIFPHPSDVNSVYIEIALRGLALSSSDPYSEDFLLLHRLNAAARLDHSWTIYIDMDDILMIGAGFPLSTLDAASLLNCLMDGVARANALDGIWKAIREGKKNPPEALADWSGQSNPLQFA